MDDRLQNKHVSIVLLKPYQDSIEGVIIDESDLYYVLTNEYVKERLVFKNAIQYINIKEE